ncbi:hypothetical protein [Mesorhizobium sp. B264B1A]|nr:hypothetical protein [Mesorhizobium sp. B264B1A]
MSASTTQATTIDQKASLATLRLGGAFAATPPRRRVPRFDHRL